LANVAGLGTSPSVYKMKQMGQLRKIWKSCIDLWCTENIAMNNSSSIKSGDSYSMFIDMAMDNVVP